MTPPYPTKDASPGLWPAFSWGFGEPCRWRFPARPRLGGGEFDRVAVEPVANSRVGRANHSGPHGREANRQGREEMMARKFIDCREFPSEMNCTIALSADSETELLEAAVQHAVAVHGHQDTSDLRDMIRGAMKDGTPPVAAPRRAT